MAGLCRVNNALAPLVAGEPPLFELEYQGGRRSLYPVDLRTPQVLREFFLEGLVRECFPRGYWSPSYGASREGRVWIFPGGSLGADGRYLGTYPMEVGGTPEAYLDALQEEHSWGFWLILGLYLVSPLLTLAPHCRPVALVVEGDQPLPLLELAQGTWGRGSLPHTPKQIRGLGFLPAVRTDPASLTEHLLRPRHGPLLLLSPWPVRSCTPRLYRQVLRVPLAGRTTLDWRAGAGTLGPRLLARWMGQDQGWRERLRGPLTTPLDLSGLVDWGLQGLEGVLRKDLSRVREAVAQGVQLEYQDSLALAAAQEV